MSRTVTFYIGFRRHLLALGALLLLPLLGWGQNLTQANFTGVVVPQYMASGTASRLPVMYRATVSGLTASTLYRYYSQGATNATTGGGTVDIGTANTGAGNPLLISSTGTTYTYTSSPGLNTAGGYETFTTDASGSYTGWFGFVNTGNARFTAGNLIFPSITLAKNVTPTITEAKYALDLSIRVLAFATSAGANNGTGLKGASNATAKNLAAVYDNTAGTGRPLAVTVVESIGATIASTPTYYTTTAGSYNTLIPNTNANGVQRVEERSVTTGAVLNCATSATGAWPSGATTVNPTGGTTPVTLTATDTPLNAGCATSFPSLTASPTNLTGFTYVAGGGPSATQSFNLTGSNLTAGSAITITGSTDYDVSTDNTTFGNTATITNTAGGTLNSTPVYVRLKSGLAAGSYNNETIAVAGGGTTSNTTVTVSGSVTAPAPVLTVNPGSLTGFSTMAGTPSGAQSYVVKGTNVTTAVTITAPSGFAVSLDNGTYGSSVSVTAANANGSGQTIYVRLTGAAAGSFSDNVSNATTGATTVNVAVSGTVTPAPVLSVSPASLTAFNTLAGSVSAARTYALSGSSLTANVTVTAPAGYAVSQDGGTTYAASQTIVPSGGSVSATIYVRLTGATAGTYGGNVGNASTGATTQNVAVTGTVVGKPTGTPAITSASPTFNSVTLNLTAAADGTNLLVVVRPSGSTATAPTDQNTYAGSSSYGAGAALGAGKVVYAASNTTSVTVTNLSQTTTYVADVYTYNVGTTSGFESYGLNSGTTSFTTPVQPPAAAGQLALEENFDYPSGTQLASSSTVPDAATGWLQNAAAANRALRTTTGNLSNFSHQYPQGVLAASPAGTSSATSVTSSGQDIYKTFTQPAGATATYAAALVRVDTIRASGDYFLHFIGSATTTFRGRLYAKAVSGSTSTFNVGLAIYTEGATYNTTTAYNVGTTYLVVVKYENSASNTSGVDNASLFVIDPTAVPTSEPATPTVGPLVNSVATNFQPTLGGIALRQGSLTTGPSVTVDALRIASGFGSAVGRVVYTSGTSTVAAGDYYSLRVTGSGTVATVSGSGPGNGVTAATSVNLEKQLNLDGGQVATSPANVLLTRARAINGDGFEILANGGTSYVDGPLAREAVDGRSLTFPIGRSGNYRPLTLNINMYPAGTTVYTAGQTEASAYSIDGTVNAPLTRVSRVRYFTITPSPVPATGAFSGSVALSFGTDDQVTDASQASLVIAKSDGNGWNNVSRSNNGTSTVTSDNFADFSNFALASTSADPTTNPLPVQLTGFAASRSARESVALTWATASELHSARFEVERSLDGQAFEKIATVAAQGSSAQTHEYATQDANASFGQLYYRLRLVDLDGTATYSPVATVAADAAAGLVLAPNPAHDQLSLLTEAATAYIVRNALGQLVLAGTTLAGSPTALDVHGLPAGLYFLALPGGARHKFVKE